MTRRLVIQRIMSHVTNEVVVSSCGMNSREVCDIKDRPRNFYIMGSMGCELMFGLGIAWCRPDLNVIVISGDGSVLMALGSFALFSTLIPPNIHHFVLDNGCHSTTGGQPTIASMVHYQNMAESAMTTIIDIHSKKGFAPRVPYKPEYIMRRFKNAIQKTSSVNDLQQKQQAKCNASCWNISPKKG